MYRELLNSFKADLHLMGRSKRTSDLLLCEQKELSIVANSFFNLHCALFYAISYLHNNRPYDCFERTIKWRSALKPKVNISNWIIFQIIAYVEMSKYSKFNA